MKKIFLAVLLPALFAVSCNSDNTKTEEPKKEDSAAEAPKDAANEKAGDHKLIIGTWKLDFEATLAQMPEDKKAKLDENTVKMLKEEYSKMDITFNENGQYQVAGADNEDDKPTWALNGKTVEVKRGERVNKYEVKELTESKLVLFSDTKGMIFPTSVYTKK